MGQVIFTCSLMPVRVPALQEANARGEELAHLLATSTAAHDAHNTLKQELVPFSARDTRIDAEAADDEVRSVTLIFGS